MPFGWLKVENAGNQYFLLSTLISQPFPKWQILDSSKLKEFADNSFKFDENGRKFSKRVKKHCGKKENC